MKKGFKASIAVAAAIVVVLVIVGAGAMIFIDSIARRGIEQGSSYALAVPTSLQSADVGIFSGTFDMDGLTISNPQGFDAPHFLRLGEGGVQVSLNSLRSDLVNLPTLRLSDLDIHVQQVGGRSNIGAILENLKRFESSEQPGAQEPSGDQTPAGGKRFIVEELRIENVRVHVDSAPLGGEGLKVDLDVPPIVMKGIGSDTGKGVLLGELADIVVKALVGAIRDAGQGVIPGELLTQIDTGMADLQSLSSIGVEVVQDLEKQASEKIDAVKQQVEKTADDLKQKGENAVDELKNILKKPGGGG